MVFFCNGKKEIAANCGAVSGASVGEGDTWRGCQLINTVPYLFCMISMNPTLVSTNFFHISGEKRNYVLTKGGRGRG
jgi:hypothetical protein